MKSQAQGLIQKEVNEVEDVDCPLPATNKIEKEINNICTNPNNKIFSEKKEKEIKLEDKNMRNLVISTLAVVAVVMVSFFLNGTSHVSNIHNLTSDEKCAIYEQVMDGFVMQE